MNLNELVPYEKNPRRNDQAVKYVAESIKQFGFKVPMVIDKDNVIVAGHTRYKASIKLRLEKLPCIVAHDLSEAQIKAYRLADNKVAEKSEWDFELLEQELADLFEFNMMDLGVDINKMSKDEMKQLLKEIYSDKVSTTIINEDRPSASEEHPTMKPLKLLERLVKNSSKQNEIVLDIFGGSGSTLMTCEQLNRSCYMMELDPKYIDVIIERWETFTQRKAIKIEGGK